MIKIGLIQLSDQGRLSENIHKHKSYIRKAADSGAQIICLQELFTTSYFCSKEDDTFFQLAEPVPGPLSNEMCKLAAELKVVLILPYFEKRAPGLYYNTAVVIDADGSYLGKYRKMHIPDDPGFYEKYYFTQGDLGYQVFNTKYGKIGVLICWDQWYPESARITALLGADILFYPTAIGTLSHEGEGEKTKFRDAWMTIQKSHAIANGCYVASVNRVGQERDITFWGGSFVAGPFGEILEQAGEEEEIIIADCDFSSIEKQRQIWPFFRDRRIDSYQGITERYLES